VGEQQNQPFQSPGHVGLSTWVTKTVPLLVLASIVLVIALAAYYPVNGLPFFVLDDGKYITGNSHIKYNFNWDTVKWAFTTFYATNWHPLTWLSHALDCRLFFLNPARHHDTNLLLHGLNVLLLFWILWRATGYAGRSFMVAALFALHPVNVESVAWISERKNLLSLFFLLLAVGAYRWYARRPRAGSYAMVAFLYAMGLMAKPQVITLPFVLLLWDYWPLQRMFPSSVQSGSQGGPGAAVPARSFSWLVVEKLPLLALSAASAVLTLKAQKAGGAIGNGLNSYPFPLRLENATDSYVRYVAKALWPSHLAIFYPHVEGLLNPWQVAGASILLLAITALVIAGRHRRYLLVGWLWFLGTLVPMIGVVQVGTQAMADRYAYLPFIGLFIMGCWGVPDLLLSRRTAASEGSANLAGHGYLSIAGLAVVSFSILLALLLVTRRQLDYWADDLTLWSHAAQVTRGNWLAEDMVGEALRDKGEPEAAMQHFRAAVAIYPAAPFPYFHIGLYEQEHGNLPEAIAQYKKVISLTQNDPALFASLRLAAFTNLSVVYRDLGDFTNAGESRAMAEQLRQP